MLFLTMKKFYGDNKRWGDKKCPRDWPKFVSLVVGLMRRAEVVFLHSWRNDLIIMKIVNKYFFLLLLAPNVISYKSNAGEIGS